jgi:K+:H+ antiporter subunit KhtT
MAQVEETPLPGVGIRYDFRTESGRRLGVLLHRSGRRELLVYSEDDPDETSVTVDLGRDDARTLAELLGASVVVEHLGELQQDLEGLSIDWVPIDEGSDWAGKTLSEAGVHTTTGVSIVAFICAGRTVAAPGAHDRLEPGTTAVAVGSPEGISILARHLRRH